MRGSLSRKPTSQSSSVAASITLCEVPNAALSCAMSLRLRARGLRHAHPLFALARRVRAQLLGRARFRHQAEAFHLRLEIGRLVQLVELRVEEACDLPGRARRRNQRGE